MKKILLLALLTALSVPAIHADYDDIYYDPHKAQKTATKKAKSNYNPNFQNQDVDAYNRRDQYYTTPVDTIGFGTENGEDFVYTRKIQKYYNPTIVVDNSDILADILENSYGNIEVIYNGGTPYFLPIYNTAWWPSISIGGWGWNLSFGSPWYRPWYSGWYNPWYGPSWSWGWGPSWAWGPSWDWGWGPGWGPAWGWSSPTWRPGRPYYADYRPGGMKPTGPRPGWSGNRRPGGNSVHNYGTPGNYSRPGSSVRPGSQTTNRRPYNGVSNGNYNYQPGNRYNGSTVNRPGNSSRPSGSGTTRPSGSSNRGGYSGTVRGNRPSASTEVNKSVTTTPSRESGTSNRGNSYVNRNSNNGTSYNYNRGNNSYRNNSTTTNRSSNSYRNSGSSYRNSGSSYRNSSGSSNRSSGSTRGGYSGSSSRGGYGGGRR